jgi:hypothetical protein
VKQKKLRKYLLEKKGICTANCNVSIAATEIEIVEERRKMAAERERKLVRVEVDCCISRRLIVSNLFVIFYLAAKDECKEEDEVEPHHGSKKTRFCHGKEKTKTDKRPS